MQNPECSPQQSVFSQISYNQIRPSPNRNNLTNVNRTDNEERCNINCRNRQCILCLQTPKIREIFERRERLKQLNLLPPEPTSEELKDIKLRDIEHRKFIDGYDEPEEVILFSRGCQTQEDDDSENCKNCCVIL